MDDMVGPVFFHCLPYMFWDNLVPAIGWLAVVDLTCADGPLALAWAKHGAMYCGVTNATYHAKQVNALWLKQLTECAVTEGVPLYDASFCQGTPWETHRQTKRPTEK